MNRREALRLSALVLGGCVSASCTRALLSNHDLAGAPAEPRLDDAELRTLALAAEAIIPATDTPGAIEAGVPNFIHRIVADWYTEIERTEFIAGLHALEQSASERFDTAFVRLRPEDRARLLGALESGSGSAGRAGATFFARLKELTVLGYYTSEIGARAELVYRPVPGEYRGDALFHDHDRQWLY